MYISFKTLHVIYLMDNQLFSYKFYIIESEKERCTYRRERTYPYVYLRQSLRLSAENQEKIESFDYNSVLYNAKHQ